ncbi:Dpc13p Ecym_7342 [Eremothecium cymbalariae DBVPG|uniref:Uncharacterized protein n=1 Tax=Eremothecium cymbalariae (strain CBS 270.75 / DBVPG 7215 / KCTC 17166 / NRRL Y-17582) TaxID=931890 RepID=G8JWF7_ERECY|nr:hypothetical protein Ecym_7342 [Eremothecium cymbalariae DBVPG\
MILGASFGRILSRTITRSSHVHVLRRTKIGTSVTIKNYATSWDKSPENLDAHLKVQKLMAEIQAHPNITSSLDHLSTLMKDKGLMNPESENGPLTAWQMIKIMMDKDVREAMRDLKAQLEKSGISLGPDQLAPLMNVLGLNKK